MVAVVAGGAGALLLRGGEGGGDPQPPPEPRGILFGSVETLDGAGVAAAEVVITAAGAARELGRTTSDELGLFEVDLGDHDGPVVVRATSQADSAATVVAVSAEGASTGVRLKLGAAGGGTVDGRVTGEGGAPVAGPGVVEARFVETGRSAVVDLAPDGAFRLEGLPLDGDLVLIATTAGGDQQGLVATAVSESIAAATADIVLGTAVGQGQANQVQDPDIVTDDLGDWTIDGPVTVIPLDDLG